MAAHCMFNTSPEQGTKYFRIELDMARIKSSSSQQAAAATYTRIVQLRCSSNIVFVHPRREASTLETRFLYGSDLATSTHSISAERHIGDMIIIAPLAIWSTIQSLDEWLADMYGMQVAAIWQQDVGNEKPDFLLMMKLGNLFKQLP